MRASTTLSGRAADQGFPIAPSGRAAGHHHARILERERGEGQRAKTLNVLLHVPLCRARGHQRRGLRLGGCRAGKTRRATAAIVMPRHCQADLWASRFDAECQRPVTHPHRHGTCIRNGLKTASAFGATDDLPERDRPPPRDPATFADAGHIKPSMEPEAVRAEIFADAPAHRQRVEHGTARSRDLDSVSPEPVIELRGRDEPAPVMSIPAAKPSS